MEENKDITILLLAIIAVFLVIGIIMQILKRNGNLNVTANKPVIYIDKFNLPDKLLQDELYPVISAFLPDHPTVNNQNVELINVKMYKDDDNIDIIELQFFYVEQLYGKEKNQFGWNDPQRLIEIKMEKDGDVYKLISSNYTNFFDTDVRIPQTSDTLYNPFARSRSWKNQQKNWNEYKKDWDVTWADIPNLRYYQYYK